MKQTTRNPTQPNYPQTPYCENKKLKSLRHVQNQGSHLAEWLRAAKKKDLKATPLLQHAFISPTFASTAPGQSLEEETRIWSTLVLSRSTCFPGQAQGGEGYSSTEEASEKGEVQGGAVVRTVGFRSESQRFVRVCEAEVVCVVFRPHLLHLVFTRAVSRQEFTTNN